MPVKVKLGPNGGGVFSSLVRFLLVLMLFCVLVGGATFSYYYFKYQSVVEKRLASGPLFPSVAQIYAAPKEVRVGQHLTISAIAADLRAAGYNSNAELGTFELQGDSILIKAGTAVVSQRGRRNDYD